MTILVDGEPADAWGAVALGEPMMREPSARAMLWLETPVEGAEVPAGDVQFAGQADVFEGHVAWEVTDAAGTIVAHGAASAAMGDFVPYTFSASLQPGTFTAYAFAPDESGGESPEGPRGWEQTRSFVVR